MFFKKIISAHILTDTFSFYVWNLFNFSKIFQQNITYEDDKKIGVGHFYALN